MGGGDFEDIGGGGVFFFFFLFLWVVAGWESLLNWTICRLLYGIFLKISYLCYVMEFTLICDQKFIEHVPKLCIFSVKHIEFKV